MSEPRYVETWLSTVMACTYLKDRAKVTGYALSRFADWDTGRDCYPSDPTIAALAGITRKTAKRGRDDLEASGFIVRTGMGRPKNTTDYALVIPASTDKVVPTDDTVSRDTVVPSDDSSTDKVVPTELRQYGHLRTPVGTPEDASRDKVVPQPPHTSSRPLGSEEDEESAYAPPPEGGALALDQAQAAILTTLRQRWNEAPVMSNRIRSLLRQLLDAGWTGDQIAAGVTTISAKPKNPVLLLEAHLKRMLSNHEPSDFDVVPPAAGDNASEQPDDGGNEPRAVERCAHGVSRNLPPGSCLHCTDLHHRMQAAIRHAERNGFTPNVGRRDEDGERDITLVAGNVRIEYTEDAHNDPYDLVVCIRNPNEEQLGRLGQCHGGSPHTVASEWRVATVRSGYPFPELLTNIVSIFALPDRRQPESPTPTRPRQDGHVQADMEAVARDVMRSVGLLDADNEQENQHELPRSQ